MQPPACFGTSGGIAEHSTSIKQSSMNRTSLDQRRADMMNALYAASGRTCGTYTGLWQEFCQDIGSNFRDTDYQELFDAVCLAMGNTKSVVIEKHAQQAIEVTRRFLLGKWV